MHMIFRMLRISGLSFKTQKSAVAGCGRTFNRGELPSHSTPSIGMIDVVRPGNVAGRLGRTRWLLDLLAANDARDHKIVAILTVDLISQAPSRNLITRSGIRQGTHFGRSVGISQAPSRNPMPRLNLRQKVGL